MDFIHHATTAAQAVTLHDALVEFVITSSESLQLWFVANLLAGFSSVIFELLGSLVDALQKGEGKSLSNIVAVPQIFIPLLLYPLANSKYWYRYFMKPLHFCHFDELPENSIGRKEGFGCVTLRHLGAPEVGALRVYKVEFSFSVWQLVTLVLTFGLGNHY